MDNILNIQSAKEFRDWLTVNYEKEKVCYVFLKRGKPKIDQNFYYLDAVEVALCFGWIDGTLTKINGKTYQKFTPRSKKSLWTELNKERVRRLIKLNLMTQAGLNVLPDMETKPIVIPNDIEDELIKNNALENFNNFPQLYKRIRIYNLVFTKTKLKNQYAKSLQHFIELTKQNKMFGEWNDYGRLLDY